MSKGKVTWNPSEFMKDEPVGRLAQQLLDAPHVELPDGTHVIQNDSGFTIHNRHGLEVASITGTGKDTARTTAAQVLDASAQSRHPESVGGHRRFKSLDKVKENRPMDTAPGQRRA